MRGVTESGGVECRPERESPVESEYVGLDLLEGCHGRLDVEYSTRGLPESGLDDPNRLVNRPEVYHKVYHGVGLPDDIDAKTAFKTSCESWRTVANRNTQHW